MKKYMFEVEADILRVLVQSRKRMFIKNILKYQVIKVVKDFLKVELTNITFNQGLHKKPCKNSMLSAISLREKAIIK